MDMLGFRNSSLLSRLGASTALLAAAMIILIILLFRTIHGEFFDRAFTGPLTDWSSNVAARIYEDIDLADDVARSHELGIVVTRGAEQRAFSPDGEPVDASTLLLNTSDYRRIDVGLNDQFSVSLFWEKSFFTHAERNILLGALMSILIIVAAIYFFQLAQLRPLKWLQSGVEAVSRGDFSTRVPVLRNDEIGKVARAFNRMTGHVETMLRDRERLLADVSHELRSPLTRAKVALELIKDDPNKASIVRDLDAMDKLISTLLEREKLTAAVNADNFSTVDLKAQIADICKEFDQAQPGVNFIQPDERITISGNSDWIDILLRNLLDNAVKFSTKDSATIEVILTRQGDIVSLIVQDDGIGMPAEQTDTVFGPFVKLESSRGHDNGHGLGLNLCQRIVLAHGGNISAESAGVRGTRICVTFPC